MNRIYFDHSATTPTSKEVLDEMLPFFCDIYGNGSSQHFHGREAGKYIDIARRQVADAIGCKAGEIYFTSGGTDLTTGQFVVFWKAIKQKANTSLQLV